MGRGSSPQSQGRIVCMTFALVYCFIVLLCVCLVPWPYVIYFTLCVAIWYVCAESAVNHHTTKSVCACVCVSVSVSVSVCLVDTEAEQQSSGEQNSAGDIATCAHGSQGVH